MPKSMDEMIRSDLYKNRQYNCRMRNLRYERSWYRFRKIVKLMESGHQDEKERQELFDSFRSELALCLEFAEAAVTGAHRKKIRRYRDDHLFGILEEEILMVSFLREMMSSVQYLENRNETDEQLANFEKQLLKSRGKSTRKGFVENAVKSLQKLQESGRGEFTRILSLIQDRYNVGNKLYAIFHDLQEFG